MAGLKHGTESKHGGSDAVRGSKHTAEGGKPIVRQVPYKEPMGPKRSGGHTNHGNCGTQCKGKD